MIEKTVEQLRLDYARFSYDELGLKRNAKGVTYFDYHAAVLEFSEAMLEVIGHSKADVLAIMPEIASQQVTGDWLSGEFVARSALSLIEHLGYLNA